MRSASSASSKPLSEKLYATLHELMNKLTAAAYERGYADAKAKKAADPTVVKVAMVNVKRIKSQ